MKKVFEELRLLLTMKLLSMAVTMSPKHRKESTLLLYYLSGYLKHINKIRGDELEKAGKHKE